MPKAERRQRKKENARIAREAAQREAKRRKTVRMVRNLVLGFGIPILALIVFYFVTTRDDSSGDAATTTTAATTTVAPTGTTLPREEQPEGSPDLVIDPSAQYTATIETSEGVITVALDPTVAKWGVNNFVKLARDGFYDGLSIHRTVTDFVIQGGDPQGTGSGGPGYTFLGEVPAQPGYAVGAVAYANASDPGAVGSQFFIVTGSGGINLPADYATLGTVTEGIDVAQTIEGFAPATPGGGTPTTPVTINSIKIDGP